MLYPPNVPVPNSAASPDSRSGSVFRCPVGRGRSSVALQGRSKAMEKSRQKGRVLWGRDFWLETEGKIYGNISWKIP